MFLYKYGESVKITNTEELTHEEMHTKESMQVYTTHTLHTHDMRNETIFAFQKGFLLKKSFSFWDWYGKFVLGGSCDYIRRQRKYK